MWGVAGRAGPGGQRVAGRQASGWDRGVDLEGSGQQAKMAAVHAQERPVASRPAVAHTSFCPATCRVPAALHGRSGLLHTQLILSNAVPPQWTAPRIPIRTCSLCDTRSSSSSMPSPVSPEMHTVPSRRAATARTTAGSAQRSTCRHGSVACVRVRGCGLPG